MKLILCTLSGGLCIYFTLTGYLSSFALKKEHVLRYYIGCKMTFRNLHIVPTVALRSSCYIHVPYVVIRASGQLLSQLNVTAIVLTWFKMQPSEIYAYWQKSVCIQIYAKEQKMIKACKFAEICNQHVLYTIIIMGLGQSNR